MFGPGSNEGAYDYSPFPGTSTRQQQNLKDYDKKYGAAAEKLRKQGFVVHGEHYFKKVPDSSQNSGYRLEKAGKVKTGHNNEALKVTPAPVVTPKSQKPAAPPQAAVDSNDSNGARGEIRSGVKPVNGSFRTAVEQGPDGKVTPSSGNAGGAQSVDPDKSGYIAPTSSKDSRTNANGLQQYGKTLGGLNEFTAAFTGGYQLADVKTAFKSNDLEGAYQTGSNTIADTGDKYELPDAQVPLTGGNSYEGAKGVSSEETSYEIPEASVPGTVGRGNTDQDGTSDKPDVADQVRQVRMRRKGPRDEGSFRGFQVDQANEFAQNSVSETKGNGMNAKRREIRSTFLNHEGNSVQAAVAANAVATYGKDANGDPRFNVGGELVYAKPGMEFKAKNAAMLGQDPSQYLDMPAAPDTPATEQSNGTLNLDKVDVTSSAFQQGTKEVQQFLKDKMPKIK